ncbi:MAG TPA: undecaprenyldiphospho-muramoylpentapeptide beta-N-acetylglucosaminyltransferase [Ignavibacteria bacterium]|nr:undecaprenyldiphospho-muramoylpentapeptide beta-N-acetylglucosaminyltransferase [Ignavibacteria bacterium]
MKIIISGGGTGGHIYPAIAIADALKKNYEEVEILFIGAKGRLEERLVPEYNYNFKIIDIAGFDRKRLHKNLGLPVKLLRSVTNSMKIIKGFNADIVIGTGGFVCFPVVYAAQRLKMPNVIQEGNSFAGKTVKMLSKRADKVIVNFDDTRKYLKRNDNVIRISHPIRSSMHRIDKVEAKAKLGLDNNKTIFIFGGSQGAAGINDAIAEIAKKLAEKNINIIWQTGKAQYENLKNKFEKFSYRIKIFEFINDMQTAYSAADLVICRAGIGSIMELASMKQPAILVPYPFATENHQEFNARSLEKENAAIVILQKNLYGDLFNKINEVLFDETRLAKLSDNIFKFADPEAADKIAKIVIETAKK